MPRAPTRNPSTPPRAAKVGSRSSVRPSGPNESTSSARRVLVVYKKSTYQTQVVERKNERYTELLEQEHRAVERLRIAHEEHVETLAETKQALADLGADATFRFRGDESLVLDFDLVVTVGGDGTLLWVARWMNGDIPILAVNSAPGHSVGHFCAGQKGRVVDALRAALEGSLKGTMLTRMQVTLDDQVLSKRVLNDALFAHASPAATSRYVLSVHDEDGRVEHEEQKSSGLWVGPSAGSTAAQRSAGGNVLPPESPNIQFVVREPYIREGGTLHLRRGEVKPGGLIEVINKSAQAHLFLDGPHHRVAVALGSRIGLTASDEPLLLLGYPRANR